MRRVVVGTTGHIDHGKTRLVEALTGVDCDRWAEEKARGITIDLGFAHRIEGDLQIGFVDVPGHERFLHNALAGLGGIRVMLLVVAADEGVKPQTVEHLAICSLLEIPAAVVALTKADLVEPDLLELAQLEVLELLADSPFAGAAVLPVSSATGEGIPELEAEISRLAEEHFLSPDLELPARLPIDRAFHLKGLGLVVTGTLVSGRMAAGDALELQPGGASARVRGVQVHGEDREAAEAGERTSLRLTGAELTETARGNQLVTAGAFAATRSLVAHMRLLPDAPKPIRGFIPIRLHLYSGEVVGKLRPLSGVLEPGESGMVEIRLVAPAVAVRGDRFIVRRPSPATTLGGGEILDPAWRRHRGSTLERALAGLGGDRAQAVAFWIEEAGAAGVESVELAVRLGEPAARVAATLNELASVGKALRTPAGRGHGERFLAPAAYRRLAERAEAELEAFFERDRLAPGMPKAEAVERFFPGRAAELAGTFLEWLEAEGRIALDGDLVTLPGRGARLTSEESELATRARRHFEDAGLAPPSPSELADALGGKRQIVDGVVRYLADEGHLARLPNGLIIAQKAVDQLVESLKESGWERFTVAQFKDRFGLSRKWAIPLLEHLDSRGITRRLGDERMLAG